jgi:hypothetical protein
MAFYGIDWDDVLAWRANWLADYRRATGRVLTGYLMPFQSRSRR